MEGEISQKAGGEGRSITDTSQEAAGPRRCSPREDDEFAELDARFWFGSFVSDPLEFLCERISSRRHHESVRIQIDRREDWEIAPT